MINARNTDPESSHLAGQDIEKAGAARAQRAICLRLVAKYPGKTSAELSLYSHLDRYQVARRLPEIKALMQGEMRYCLVCKKLCVTWWLVGEEHGG